MNVRPSRPALLTLLAALAAAAGCGRQNPAATAGPVTVSPWPELGPARTLEPGVVVHEVALTTGGRPGDGKVWVYLPDKPPTKPVPGVLVAPAGSPLLFGMALGEGDRAEHLPYVRAGFGVVAYAISGDVPDSVKNSDAAVLAGAREFRDAEAGLADARRALDFLAAKVPAIDPERVYAAGHSSAATLALLAAEREPRLAGCIAFAPCTDVEKRLSGAVRDFNRALPGFADFLKESSPRNHAGQLRRPLFLFHADDDSNVPAAESADFAARVKANNPDVTLVRVPRGGHYQPMVKEGIPRAIRWLKDRTGAPPR